MRAGLLFALALLAGCDAATPAPAVTLAPAVTRAVSADVVTPAQDAAATVIVPAAVALRESVQAALPVQDAQAAPSAPALSDTGLAHIVRWEITSEARYNRSLTHPVWPGGASGITWCIGYDGGHQTAHTIRADWRAHAQVDRLAQTSGIVGTAARRALPQFRDITTAYQPCLDVFQASSAPTYMRATERAYGVALRDQPQGVIDALFGNTYNRGGSMLGMRNREKRAIRDDCLPAHDRACVAAQLRAMKRLWPDVPGLQARRESEARLAEAGA